MNHVQTGDGNARSGKETAVTMSRAHALSTYCVQALCQVRGTQDPLTPPGFASMSAGASPETTGI